MIEAMTLDENNQPKTLIENWDSFIWAERYNTSGDFQIKTGLVSETLQLLPKKTLITLRDTNQVMQVETHQIERKKNQPQTLTITGRAYDKILSQRIAIQSVESLTGSDNWTVNIRTPSDLAYFIINQICVEGIISPADIFPSEKLYFPAPADYNTSTGPVQAMVVQRGNLLSVVQALLATETAENAATDPVTPAVVQHGIRAVRPSSGSTAIAIEIYLGEDRGQTVYFDGKRQLLDDGTYLFSDVGDANVAYGVGEGMAATMFEGETEPTGLDRSVILVDASTSGLGDVSVLQGQMSQSLSAAHPTAMFDGTINPDINPYIYGIDYNLGDTVRLVGDYELDSRARVTEFIRSEDASGYKAYPTLSAINT